MHALRVSTPVSCQTIQSVASMQAVRGGVDLGRLVEDLERLREEPLRRDLPAVAVEPVLPGRPGDLVDAVRLGLGGVVLPELDPGVRVRAEGREHREGVPSAVAGSIVHAVTSMPMPMMSAGSTPASRMTAGTAVLQHVEVVVGVLERPVGRQDDVLVRGAGAARR